MEGYKTDEFGNILLPEVISSGIQGKEWISILKEKGYEFGGIGSSGYPGLSERFFETGEFISTTEIFYHPVVVFGNKYKREDRFVPSIKEEYLLKGYVLLPMECFPIILVAPFFDDFLKKAKCRFVDFMQNPVHVPRFGSDHERYSPSLDYGVSDCSKKIGGTYEYVHFGFFNDCLFIFGKK